MNCEEWVALLGIAATEEQLMAARHLELRGLVFAADFGLDNCEDILFKMTTGGEKEDG